MLLSWMWGHVAVYHLNTCVCNYLPFECKRIVTTPLTFTENGLWPSELWIRAKMKEAFWHKAANVWAAEAEETVGHGHWRLRTQPWHLYNVPFEGSKPPLAGCDFHKILLLPLWFFNAAGRSSQLQVLPKWISNFSRFTPSKGSRALVERLLCRFALTG